MQARFRGGLFLRRYVAFVSAGLFTRDRYCVGPLMSEVCDELQLYLTPRYTLPSRPGSRLPASRQQAAAALDMSG